VRSLKIHSPLKKIKIKKNIIFKIKNEFRVL